MIQQKCNARSSHSIERKKLWQSKNKDLNLSSEAISLADSLSQPKLGQPATKSGDEIPRENTSMAQYRANNRKLVSATKSNDARNPGITIGQIMLHAAAEFPPTLPPATAAEGGPKAPTAPTTLA